MSEAEKKSEWGGKGKGVEWKRRVTEMGEESK